MIRLPWRCIPATIRVMTRMVPARPPTDANVSERRVSDAFAGSQDADGWTVLHREHAKEHYDSSVCAAKTDPSMVLKQAAVFYGVDPRSRLTAEAPRG